MTEGAPADCFSRSLRVRAPTPREIHAFASLAIRLTLQNGQGPCRSVAQDEILAPPSWPGAEPIVKKLSRLLGSHDRVLRGAKFMGEHLGCGLSRSLILSSVDLFSALVPHFVSQPSMLGVLQTICNLQTCFVT